MLKINRITVTIGGIDYTILSEEDAEHVKRSARLVDEELEKTRGLQGVSTFGGAVLAAMNIAGRYYKEGDNVENLRAQVRSYAEENARLRAEVGRLKKK